MSFVKSIIFIFFNWLIVQLLKCSFINRWNWLLILLLLLSHVRLLCLLMRVIICLILLRIILRSNLCFMSSKLYQIHLHINPWLYNLTRRWSSSLLRKSSLHHYSSICICSPYKNKMIRVKTRNDKTDN